MLVPLVESDALKSLVIDTAPRECYPECCGKDLLELLWRQRASRDEVDKLDAIVQYCRTASKFYGVRSWS